MKDLLKKDKRKFLIKIITKNLGSIVEDDESITCYVKKNRIPKKYGNHSLICFGKIDDETMSKNYNLNKKIRYVLDGIDFGNKQVNIFGYDNCEVIIKNCNFGLNIFMHVNGKCTIDNCNISVISSSLISATDLELKNIKKDHIEFISDSSKISLGANNNISIENSYIGSDEEKSYLSFSANNEINIKNSTIYGDSVVCDSKKINIDNDSVIRAEKVQINSKEFEPIHVNASKIKVFDQDISKNSDDVIIRNNSNPIDMKRLEIVDLIGKLENYCRKEYYAGLNKYSDEFNNKSIENVFKKK